MPDGTERPITFAFAFASRTLSSSEHNYSQIERGAGPNIWGQEISHLLVWTSIYISLEHKLLFGPKKGIPTMAAARLQGWTLL